MEIKDELLVINTSPVDSVGGAKPEPEERPLTRVLATTGARVGMNTANVSADERPNIDYAGLESKRMSTSINEHKTVEQHILSQQHCMSCRHFDRPAFQRLLRRWTESERPEDRAGLDQVRSAAFEASPRAEDGSRDPNDINRILDVMGICPAYTSYMESLHYSKGDALTIMHPSSICRGEMTGPLEPELPKLYRPRRLDAIRKWRDELLLKAAGKIK